MLSPGARARAALSAVAVAEYDTLIAQYLDHPPELLPGSAAPSAAAPLSREPSALLAVEAGREPGVTTAVHQGSSGSSRKAGVGLDLYQCLPSGVERVRVKQLRSGRVLAGSAAPQRKHLHAWLARNPGWVPIQSHGSPTSHRAARDSPTERRTAAVLAAATMTTAVSAAAARHLVVLRLEIGRSSCGEVRVAARVETLHHLSAVKVARQRPRRQSTLALTPGRPAQPLAGCGSSSRALGAHEGAAQSSPPPSMSEVIARGRERGWFNLQHYPLAGVSWWRMSKLRVRTTARGLDYMYIAPDGYYTYSLRQAKERAAASPPSAARGSDADRESGSGDDDDEAAAAAVERAEARDATGGGVAPLTPIAPDWPTVLCPPAPPPVCECGAPCVWIMHRWWCAGGRDGCGFESEALPAPAPLTPLCACARPCKWLLNRWWCARHPTGGCGFELTPTAHAEPTHIPHGLATRRPPSDSVAVAAARDCAAMLTASAFGLDDWCYVAPTDCGLGLFARSALRKGQHICEYDGPHLPLEMIAHGECAPLSGPTRLSPRRR